MTTPQASAPQPPADRASPAGPRALAEPDSDRDHPTAPLAPAGDSTPGSGSAPAVRVACGVEIGLYLVTCPGDEIPFPARLTYTQADPYAVRLHCHTGPTSTVTWVLSRETLRQGLDRPSGIGDVHIRPAPGPGPDGQGSVLITLGSGRDAALLRGATTELQRFLHLSAAVVPPGTEDRHLDLDALISRLRRAP